MRRICLLFFLVLISISGCHAVQESIKVAGWKFAADLGEGWKLDSTAPAWVEPLNDWADCYSKDVMWTGTMAHKPFFVPKGPTEMHYSGITGKSGYIDIQVLKVPEQFKSLGMADLLKAAVDINHCYTVDEGDEKDIEFDGKESHLWEWDGNMDGKDYGDGIIAIKLSDSEIGIIDISRWDGAGRAWDAMNTFTITPSEG
jgi:hypothetical protein